MFVLILNIIMEFDSNKFTCINCATQVKSLYRKYSATVLKLTECEHCHHIADKYVEYDIVIIIIDLVLLRIMAYRHILLNTEFKNFWKLTLTLLLLETYSCWTLSSTVRPQLELLNNTEPYLTETDIYLDDFKFYKMSFNIAVSTSSFIMFVYLLTKFYTHFKTLDAVSLVTVCKTITLSSCGMFLLLPSLVWDISVHELHIQFISLYTTLSQLIAYRALCNCEKFWSLVVIFSSYILKVCVIDILSMTQLFLKTY